MYVWKLGRNCVYFNPRPLEWERFFLESEASPPTTLQEFFFTFKISLADSYFWLFPWKKRIGIGSHMFRQQLEQLRVQPCIPHAPESEINPWKRRHMTEERSFPLFFHVYTNNLPQSPPQEQRAAAPSGNARAGIKGEQDPWVRTCKHRHEVQRGKNKPCRDHRAGAASEIPNCCGGWDKPWATPGFKDGEWTAWILKALETNTQRALLFAIIGFNSQVCNFFFFSP